jgi:hypothetical protein
MRGGPRHHSSAIAQFPAPKRLQHFMLQLRDMDDVGNTYYLCQDRRVPSDTAKIGFLRLRLTEGSAPVSRREP